MSSTSKEYWDQNLDPGNLERSDIEKTFLQYLKICPHEKDVSAALDQWPEKGIAVDLGAGLGQYSIAMAKRGHTVIAVDVSLNRLQILKRLLQKYAPELEVFLIQAKAENLPFKDLSVDYLFTHSVLIHTDLQQSLPEMKRIVRSQISLIEPSVYNPIVKLYRNTLAPSEWKSITLYFSKKTEALIDSVFQNDFTVSFQPWHFLNFLSYVWVFAFPIPWLFSFFGMILEPVDRCLLKPLLRKWFWMYLISIKRKK